MNETLSDELTTINAIYPPGDDGRDTLTVLASEDEATYTSTALRLPSHPAIAIRLVFPANYPDEPPEVQGTLTAGSEGKGEGKRIADLVKDCLRNTWQAGQPCIFDLIEESETVLQAQAEEHAAEDDQDLVDNSSNHTDNAILNSTPTIDNTPLYPEPPWTLSEPITEKKSVFLARAAPVTSPAQARSYLRHLLTHDKRAAKATHNISAWRIRSSTSSSTSQAEHTTTKPPATPTATYQDCDSDGETAAGGRMLHLLQLLDVWDVMVVVTRWYGGVLLGPARFGIINSAARDALVRGGWVAEEHLGRKEGGAGGGGRKGKRG